MVSFISQSFITLNKENIDDIFYFLNSEFRTEEEEIKSKLWLLQKAVKEVIFNFLKQKIIKREK
jgi:hypothetical protein